MGCGEGCPFQSRSGGTVPSVLKTFSSLKHSVSIIWKRANRELSEQQGRHKPCRTLHSAMVGTSRSKDFCPANLPHSAMEWARFLWQTSGRSHCLWAPAPPLSPWRTAQCPEHPCSRWPEAKQHKDCSNARLCNGATNTNKRLMAKPRPPPPAAQNLLDPVLPGSRKGPLILFCQAKGKGMCPISSIKPHQGSCFLVTEEARIHRHVHLA